MSIFEPRHRPIDEAALLADLTPHARLHARALLAAVPRLVVTSGRRSPDRNRRAGGSPRSYHLTGRAVDLVGAGYDLELGLRTARAQRVTPRCTGPEEALIHDAGSGLHLHVAW